MTISVLYRRYIVEIREIRSACLIGALGVVHTPREERTNLKIRETSTQRDVYYHLFRAFDVLLIKDFFRVSVKTSRGECESTATLEIAVGCRANDFSL